MVFVMQFVKHLLYHYAYSDSYLYARHIQKENYKMQHHFIDNDRMCHTFSTRCRDVDDHFTAGTGCDANCRLVVGVLSHHLTAASSLI